jgi:DNA-binding NarL/FixJ family response regulator
MAKIGIVEDNLLLRQNLLKRLSGFPEIEVTLVCANGQQFLEGLSQLTPDKFPQVVLMDVEMDVMDGIKATALTKDQYPNLHILMLSVFDDDERVFEAIRAGASGYLLKEETAASLVEAIRGAIEGKVYMSPAIARKTLEFIRKTPPPTAATRKSKSQQQPGTPGLSKRELEILEMLSKGHTYQSISSTLFLSEYTVQTHIKNIYGKLQVNNKISAIRIAMDRKWF